MRTELFDYDLPKDLIAQHPLPERDTSKLLVLDRRRERITHTTFRHVLDRLSEGQALVLNDSKVVPAKVVGRRTSTGGRVEALFLHPQNQGHCLALLRARGRLQPGEEVSFEEGQVTIRLVERLPSNAWRIEIREPDSLMQLLEDVGRAPLPPYIRRRSEDRYRLDDLERYQTVYARQRGSIAAPTAGLHFTRGLLEALREKSVRVCSITLHVGLATFQPIRAENLGQHVMHAESFEFPQEAADAVVAAKREGRKVVAVGTTSCRVLETVARRPEIAACSGWTDLFIRPPFEFRMVDALITNFHLPRSTLLVLVCAFAGRHRILKAYAEAVRRCYRFYSYGDAMLIL